MEGNLPLTEDCSLVSKLGHDLEHKSDVLGVLLKFAKFCPNMLVEIYKSR